MRQHLFILFLALLAPFAFSEDDYSNFHSNRYSSSYTEKALELERAYKACEALKQQYLGQRPREDGYLEQMSSNSKQNAAQTQSAYQIYQDCIQRASSKRFDNSDTYITDSETGEKIPVSNEISIKPQK